MHIFTPEERMAERRGAKILVLGPTGVGKTSLLKTLDPARVLFVDGEAGDLSVLDLPVPSIRLTDWPTARDLACRIAGPDSSAPPNSPYSQRHFDSIGGPLPNLDEIDVLFVDSITEASRLSFRWSESQPESFSDRSGKKDLRGAYGLHAREMLRWLSRLQHARAKHVVLIGILEPVIDDLNRQSGWQLQCEGSKTARELPAIIDCVVTMQFLDFGDSQAPARGFVCCTPNPWGYPGKDRSGRLDQVEPPDLGRLLSKLTQRSD
jgi:hypothetical protein